MPQLTVEGMKMNVGYVFCDIKELTLDTDNGLPELFVKHCPSVSYPLTYTFSLTCLPKRPSGLTRRTRINTANTMASES